MNTKKTMKTWFAAGTLVAAWVVAAGGATKASRETVMASEFGWNPTNATACLQAAFDSGARKVLIDRQPSDWLVSTVYPRSGQEVVVGDGVTVRARSGAFKGITESLFCYRFVTNVVLRAEGSGRLMMNRKEYWQTDAYDWSEWRHAVNLMGVANVVIRDITIEESGGDGIYVNGVDNGLFENVRSLRNHRQGMSIIGCRGLVVRNCLFAETRGTLPECGIDMEPSGARFVIEDVLFENCRFLDNNCHGIALNVSHFKGSGKDLKDIRFVNCVSKRNRHRGVWLVLASGICGRIQFDGCEIADNVGGPLSVEELPGDSVSVDFRRCLFDASSVSEPAINLTNGRTADDMAGLTFSDCRVRLGRGEVAAFSAMTGVGIRQVRGTLDVTDAQGKRSAFDFAPFAARFRPQPELRTFAVTPVDIGNLRPRRAEACATASRPANFRFGVTFLQYVAQPGDYRIRFDIQPLGRWSKINAKLDVYDQNGTTHDSVEIHDATFTYTLKARFANVLYRMRINVGNARVHVTSPYPGQGFLADQATPWMGADGQSFFFEVKKGSEAFKIEFAPQPNEFITAELLDPQGVVVDRFENRGATSFLTGRRPKGAPSEIWQVRCVKFVEDCSVRLGAGLTAVYAMDPDLVLVEK